MYGQWEKQNAILPLTLIPKYFTKLTHKERDHSVDSRHNVDETITAVFILIKSISNT